MTKPLAPCEVLRRLCGYVEDDSNTSVTISQDDSTKDWILVIGNKKQEFIFSETFMGLFDAALKYIPED